MTEGIPSVFPVDLTRKWRALAERRKAYLVGLYDSGRWKLYYSEREFIARLREAIHIVERWSATEQSAADESATVSIAPAGRNGDTRPGRAGEETLSRIETDENAGLDDPGAEIPLGGEPENSRFGGPDEGLFSVDEAERERELA